MAERTRNPSLTVTRTLGAVALLAIGGVHYHQYHYAFYSSIPTIGPLFLLNFIAATALGLFLLVPVRSWLGRRGKPLDQLAALGGIGIAAGGLAALLMSEQTLLFGFMEHGYRFVIVLTIASDAVAIATLTLFLIRTRTGPRSPTTAPRAKRSDVAAGRRTHQPTTCHPRSRDVVAVAMQKQYEITIPGLSMKGRLSRRPSPLAR